MATILDKIIETKRQEVAAAQQQRSRADLRQAASEVEPARNFIEALNASPRLGIHLIAEIKKASPSAGVIVDPFDPIALAQTYEAHGATAISVLTDSNYFQGHLDNIKLVKGVVSLPVLRKDFIVGPYQVYESRVAGADAILLIAEVLKPDEIELCHEIARDLGMGVIVEVHTEENLLRVLKTLGPPTRNAYALGINNRDLARQQTDLATTQRLAKLVPQDSLLISESGISTRVDVIALQQCGVRSMLVGESLLRAENMGRLIDELLGAKSKP